MLNGTVHKIPKDLEEALLGSKSAESAWHDITPLARNEWICWIVSVKKPETRIMHIQRAVSDLAKGKRRPCCWAGCPHRNKKITSVILKDMKTNTQTGFVPFIVALIIALSVGGGVVAYRAQEHKREAKLEQELKIEAEKDSVDSKLAVEGGSKSSESINSNKKYEYEDRDEDEDDDDRSTQTSSSGSQTTPTTTAKTYSLAEIKTHNTKASCWTVVNGSVYDVTSWISKHPGGQMAITSMCGIDASAAFNGQHGGQARPVSELASFKIGALK